MSDIWLCDTHYASVDVDLTMYDVFAGGEADGSAGAAQTRTSQAQAARRRLQAQRQTGA